MGSHTKPCKTCRTYFYGFPDDEYCWSCKPSNVTVIRKDQLIEKSKEKIRILDSGEVQLILETEVVEEEN